jgi:hypothetical protein
VGIKQGDAHDCDCEVQMHCDADKVVISNDPGRHEHWPCPVFPLVNFNAHESQDGELVEEEKKSTGQSEQNEPLLLRKRY